MNRRVLCVLRPGDEDLIDIHTALRRAGLILEESSSVPDAWKRVLDHPYDGVVVDVDLPVIMGWELVARMRQDPRYERLPVVVVDEEPRPHEMEHARALDATYLPRPVDPADIVAMLEELWRRAQYEEMRQVRVLLLTDICEIEGNVHLPSTTLRFSDGWEAIVGDRRSFIPITDARVTNLEGNRLVATTSFMQVTKSQVRSVLPVDAQLNADTSVEDSKRLVAELTKIAARLAKELADERNVPVEDMLQQIVDVVEHPLPTEQP